MIQETSIFINHTFNLNKEWNQISLTWPLFHKIMLTDFQIQKTNIDPNMAAFPTSFITNLPPPRAYEHITWLSLDVSPLSTPWLKLKSVNPRPVVCGFFPHVFHLSYQAYIHHRISYTKAVTNFYLLFHPPCNTVNLISIFLPLFHSKRT